MTRPCQFRVISTRKCICNSLTKQNFRAELWISEQKFTQRLVTWGRGQNSDAERKTGVFFSGRQVDFVQMETIAIFRTRMPRDAVRLCGKKWKTQEKSHPEQVRKWRNGLTWKTQTVWRPVLRLELKKIPCLWLTRWKRLSCNYRHHPVCRVYKSGKLVHLWHSLPSFDMLTRRNLSAGSRKEGNQGTVAVVRRKKTKVPRLCFPRLRSSEFYSTERWRIGIERFGGTHQKFSGCIWYETKNSGKKRAIWMHDPKRWTSWAKSSRARFWGLNTCRAWTVICSSSSLSSTSRSTVFFFSENWDHYQIQSRLEVTSMHAGNRCWQILTSRPRETVNQHAKHFSDEMCKEDPTQDIPDWLQPVTVNLEDLEKCARRFLWKSEHRFGRWRFKSGDTKTEATVFMLTSANTERDLFHEQKRLVTWQHWSRKQSPVRCRGTRSHHSVDITRVKTELHRRRRRIFMESFQSRRRSQKLFIWSIVKNYHRTAISHRWETWNCRTSCTSSKRRDISVLLQSGLNEEWWSDSMKCFY